METLKYQKNVMPELMFQEPSAALLSAPTFQLVLLVEELHPSAPRDQNVEDLWPVVNWFAHQDNPRKSEPSAVKEVSSPERPARLTVLAPNKLIIEDVRFNVRRNANEFFVLKSSQ
jgi:hypothetical protein